MKSLFKELFEYNRLMNLELIQAMVLHAGQVSEKSVKWINHIVNAHGIWNGRIDAAYKSGVGVWDVGEVAALESINEAHYKNTIAIIDAFEFETIIEYVTSKGIPFQSSIRDILFHVINHGTYHRGQIASNFRETGLEPIVSDWVFYKRGR